MPPGLLFKESPVDRSPTYRLFSDRLSSPRLLVSLLALLPLGVCAAGCSDRSADQGSPEAEAAERTSADEVLQRMIAAYAGAESYRDRGVVRLSYREQGAVQEDEAPLAVAFQRPNRIRLAAYQLDMASDGQQLKARINDQATNDLDNQLLVREAPQELTLGQLYADPVVDDVLRGGLGRYPVQLELLLSGEPLAGFRGKDARRELLENATLREHPCYRVRVTTEEGSFILWIDRETSVLHRLEFPTGQLEASMQSAGEVDQVQLSADFVSAELNPAVETAAFELAAPADARQVRAFLLPPEPLLTNLYGQRPSPFAFTELDGGRLEQRELRGTVSVLVWFTLHPTCRATLQQLDNVREKLAGRGGSLAEKVRFVAVSTEPSTVSHQALQDRLREWDVDLPLVRDLDAFGRDVFAIPGAPTVIVLDAQGNVQMFEVGTNPELADQLPLVLERLVAGEDLASQLLASFRVEQENYQRLLEAGGASEVAVMEVPKTPIRPASQPARLVLEKLWTNRDFQAAGNLLVVEDKSASPRILVLDGFQTVVELDASGQSVARRTLDLPEGAAVTYLRSAVGSAGERLYAASALRAPQVHVFDQDWKTLFRYPSTEEEHPGIHDTLLADMDGKDGLELYAGFWGVVGIHAVDRQGRRQWSNRAATNVLTLALTPQNEVGWHKLLASSDLGPLTRLNQFGRHDQPIHVGNRAIHHIYSTAPAGSGHGGKPEASPDPTSGPAADSHATYCGLSYQGPGQMLAIGLNEQFTELWNYPLPAGTYETEVQFVHPLPLPGDQAGWLFAGPDGSVHVVSNDGDFHDNFATGQPVTGLAALRLPEGPAVLIAAPDGLTAWRIALP
jgi:hypothetical protein